MTRRPTPGGEPADAHASLRQQLAARFSLHVDRASDEDVDQRLRAAVELRGATPWILVCAIFIASVGLNVNATPVIIGAMLVSPLMGPIMGVGYGVGIYDFPLVRRSLANLAIASAIALITSTVYFLLTPLTGAQSELLARTTPTIWDVLIALFGGLAGVIGATRRDHSNVIPGVAIATALMPPLCTVGYGLATSNLDFVLGAAYLFAINAVFIAVATALVIWRLHLPHRQFVDATVARRVRLVVIAMVLGTSVPSVYLASQLVARAIFDAKARQYVAQHFDQAGVHVTGVEIDAERRRIEVSLVGDPLPAPALDRLRGLLGEAGLSGASLVVHQPGDHHVDVATLKASIVADLLQQSQRELAERDRVIQDLRQQLAQRTSVDERWQAVAREARALHPELERVVVGSVTGPTEGDLPDAPGAASEAFAASSASAASSPVRATPATVLLVAYAPRAMPAAQVDQLERWLRSRTDDRQARVIVEAGPRPRP